MDKTQDRVPQTGGSGEMRTSGNAEEVAAAAADLFIARAKDSVAARGRFRVALSGGSTPRRTYELLAAPERNSQVDWARVDLFWGDERYVASDDGSSNFRMTKEALLQHLALPSAHVYRVQTEIKPPEAAAAAYEEAIRQCFGTAAGTPQFDLVYLGLGTNGHTASLFPHCPALRENARLVVADFIAEVNMHRITMTAPLINAARTVAFLIAGEEKAQVLWDVIYGASDPDRLPAQLIHPRTGELLWLVDRGAAGLCSKQSAA